MLLGASIVLALLVSACGGKLPQAASSPSASPSPSYAPLQVAAATLPAGEVALTYSATAFQPTGGVEPYTFQVVDGAIPAGLQLSPDGILAGSPAAAGTFNFTVQLTDAAGNQTTSQGTVAIMPKLAVTPASAGAIQVEQGCVTACGLFATHVGGQSPLTYTLVSGVLPPGTSLSGTSLAGTFTTVGTYQFTVKVTDTLGASDTTSPNFSVYRHLAFNPVNGAWCEQAQSHPDCHVVIPLTGGSPNRVYSATFVVVSGNPSKSLAGLYPTVETYIDPRTDVAAVNVVIMVQVGSGISWQGELLVTVTDQAICGPAATSHCSAQLYVKAAVTDPNLF